MSESKITVRVEDGAEHGASVSRNATTTGHTYETKQVAAGEEETFVVGEEQRLVIDRGAATPEKTSTKKGKDA